MRVWNVNIAALQVGSVTVQQNDAASARTKRVTRPGGARAVAMGYTTRLDWAITRTVVHRRRREACMPDELAPTPMVWGLAKAMVKTAMWTRVAWLALRAYGGPVRALESLRRMRAEHQRLQAWRTRKYARVDRRYFWNLYAPGYPSKAFDRFVERELDRVSPHRGLAPALQTVVLAITKRCGYACEHCCEWDALNGRETLTLHDLRDAIARFQARGVGQIFLSGGEPLQRFDDLLALVRSASAESDLWILTSGHRLTLERAAELHEAGLTGVALSLDHPDAAGHDRFRGVDDAFEWVERAARHARDAGLVVALSLCPTRDLVSEASLEAYARTARRLGASFIQILEPKPVGRWAGCDVALTPAQQRLLETFEERLNTRSAHLDDPAVSYLERTHRRSACSGAGDRQVYVDTDGSLHACPFCRAPGGPRVGPDLDGALAALQREGCPARAAFRREHG